MKTPLNFAVVGCGNIGGRHLAVIDSLDEATVAGICDVDPTKREKYSTSYGNISSYESIHELLARCDTHVVSICTPHYYFVRSAAAETAAPDHPFEVLRFRRKQQRGESFPDEAADHRDRDLVQAELAAEGIATTIQYPCPLPLLPAYARHAHRPEEYPVASGVTQRIPSVALYPEMNEAQESVVMSAPARTLERSATTSRE
jgi:hypothetical protein